MVRRLLRRPADQSHTRVIEDRRSSGLPLKSEDRVPTRMSAEFNTSLRDFDAANWDELSQQLDRVNDLLQRLVEDVAGRPNPP